jgi:hypothetical protein
MLTNRLEYKGRPEYIKSYGLSGDTGSILKNKGYKRKIYYYDHTLDGDKFTNFYVNPIKIAGYKGTDSSLIPDDESIRANEIKKWMSIDYGNTHREWNAAELINDHNISELNKVKLIVETSGINFQVIRGTGIPVLIYLTTGEKIKQDSFRKNEYREESGALKLDPLVLVVDDTVSGKYYVNGVKYIYDKNAKTDKYRTEFQLSRLNWSTENNIL